jgi:hypothetical protein
VASFVPQKIFKFRFLAFIFKFGESSNHPVEIFFCQSSPLCRYDERYITTKAGIVLGLQMGISSYKTCKRGIKLVEFSCSILGDYILYFIVLELMQKPPIDWLWFFVIVEM